MPVPSYFVVEVVERRRRGQVQAGALQQVPGPDALAWGCRSPRPRGARPTRAQHEVVPGGVHLVALGVVLEAGWLIYPCPVVLGTRGDQGVSEEKHLTLAPFEKKSSRRLRFQASDTDPPRKTEGGSDGSPGRNVRFDGRPRTACRSAEHSSHRAGRARRRSGWSGAYGYRRGHVAFRRAVRSVRVRSQTGSPVGRTSGTCRPPPFRREAVSISSSGRASTRRRSWPAARRGTSRAATRRCPLPPSQRSGYRVRTS